ncbi:MAG: hypothetical protein ACPL7M_00395 [Bryobacteraceae bacterium]
MDYYALYKASGRRDELAERDWDANDPAGFQKLEPEQQAALLDWIRAVLVPAKTVFRRTSYGMKHDFEREPDGFYIYNGAFKGAMLEAGFQPVDASEINWRFRVRPAWPLQRWESEQRRQWGRCWLVRDRWREKGYMVTAPGQRRRIGEHDAACQRERRTKLLVLRGAGVAEIILDTYPAGYRLTDDAVEEIAALFDKLNPSGKNWSITNYCLAVIRRVPVWQAEEVAAALVQIAERCRVETDCG